MAEIRINATGGVKLYDADDSHYAQIIAGTITSNVDVLTLGHASADFNIPVKVLGTTPTLTIGDAGAEDTKIVFDGNAQDFYIGLDDSADDLLIGLGSTVGTTPAISIDENLAISTYGDITMTGATPTLTIGDAGAEDAKIVFDGNAQDFYIGLDDSADDLLIGLGSAVGTTPAISIDENLQSTFGGDVIIGGATPTLTIGDAGAEDTKIVFDGNAQDWHIGLDDSADDLVIGLGSTLGTTTHMSFDETGAVIKPLQPAFSCHQTSGISAQSLTDATAIIINLNSEVYDVNGDASSTGVFTAPVTGKYLLSCQCGGDAGSSSNVRFDNVVAQIHTSNRIYYFDSSGTAYSDANDKVWNGGSVLADMDASDTATLKFYVKRNGDTTATTTVQAGDSSGLQTWMTGYLAC